MLRFDKTRLQPADILHCWGVTWASRLIEWGLNDGSHDALAIPFERDWYAGDALPPRCTLTSLDQYETEMNAERPLIVAVYRVPEAAAWQRADAAQWWVSNVLGRPYDFSPYFKIILKKLGSPFSAKIANWQWADWCTEGGADAWKFGGGIDVWRKKWPTPLTTQKRVEQGRLLNVTQECVVWSGQNERAKNEDANCGYFGLGAVGAGVRHNDSEPGMPGAASGNPSDGA